MESKSDEEKLEEWNKRRLEKEREQFGFNIGQFENNNKINKLTRKLNFSGKIFLVIAYIIIFLFVAFVLNKLISGMKSSISVNVEKFLKDNYNIKVKMIYMDVDEHKNVVYKFEVKNNKKIQFTAIKKWDDFATDFPANSHKYYFDLWNSPNRKYFTVIENYSDGLLNFETYINVNNEEDIKEKMHIINEFVRFCGSKNVYPKWHLYLKKDYINIYPYERRGMTEDEANKRAVEIYNDFF